MARAAVAVVVSLLASSSLAVAAAPLFPTPLHITRQVHDSISGKTAVLEEYAYGNRLVSIRGDRTSIADYDKGELTEIDRSQGTYSVTTFDAVARANREPAAAAAKTHSAAPDVHALQSVGAKPTKMNRPAEFFQADVDANPGKETIEVGVDRSVRLSKEALEVLVGAAYPATRTFEHDAAISAASPQGRPVVAQSTAAQAAQPLYALPVEETIRYDIGGQQIEFRTTVVRIGAEAAPPDLVTIPAGARLVTSRMIAVREEIDRLQHPDLPPPPERR